MAQKHQKTLQWNLPLKKEFQIFKYPEEPMAAQSPQGQAVNYLASPRQVKSTIQMTRNILEWDPVFLNPLTL